MKANALDFLFHFQVHFVYWLGAHHLQLVACTVPRQSLFGRIVPTLKKLLGYTVGLSDTNKFLKQNIAEIYRQGALKPGSIAPRKSTKS